MAVGAKDHIDMALVKKYAGLRVDSPTVQASMVDPNKMYDAMNDYAQMQRAMLNIHQNLRSACIKTTALGIQYRKSREPEPIAKPA